MTDGRYKTPLGSWLAEILKSRAMTQRDLALKIGVDPAQVSKWMRGARNPDFAHCNAIATALTVPVWEVLAFANRIPPALHVEPTGHPVRDRMHVIVDRVDPEILEHHLALLERYLAAIEA